MTLRTSILALIDGDDIWRRVGATRIEALTVTGIGRTGIVVHASDGSTVSLRVRAGGKLAIALIGNDGTAEHVTTDDELGMLVALHTQRALAGEQLHGWECIGLLADAIAALGGTAYVDR